jgi:Zn-dependent M28 family amino/carboxypeptidase
VIGLLELSRLLKGQKLKQRIDLVAYTLEEPPYFRTEYMGSYIHAKSLVDNKTEVYGMVSLEMIGYFRDEKKHNHILSDYSHFSMVTKATI